MGVTVSPDLAGRIGAATGHLTSLATGRLGLGGATRRSEFASIGLMRGVTAALSCSA